MLYFKDLIRDFAARKTWRQVLLADNLLFLLKKTKQYFTVKLHKR